MAQTYRAAVGPKRAFEWTVARYEWSVNADLEVNQKLG